MYVCEKKSRALEVIKKRDKATLYVGSARAYVYVRRGEATMLVYE